MGRQRNEKLTVAKEKLDNTRRAGHESHLSINMHGASQVHHNFANTWDIETAGGSLNVARFCKWEMLRNRRPAW